MRHPSSYTLHRKKLSCKEMNLAQANVTQSLNIKEHIKKGSISTCSIWAKEKVSYGMLRRIEKSGWVKDHVITDVNLSKNVKKQKVKK